MRCCIAFAFLPLVAGLLYRVDSGAPLLAAEVTGTAQSVTGASNLRGELDEAASHGVQGSPGDASLECASVEDANAAGGADANARKNLVAGSKAMAGSHRSSDVDREAETEISAAMMKGPCHLGTPEGPLDAIVEPVCLPSYAHPCPKDWVLEGQLCHADASYEGPCHVVQDLGAMVMEQKEAFSGVCKVAFPCVENCEKDLSRCPSEWEEVAPGICDAPTGYVGSCDGRLEIAGSMTAADKEMWSVVCGAPWPCLAPPRRDYSNICPYLWTLQSGSACQAPKGYSGPCGSIAFQMPSTQRGKKEFEADCGVSWPSLTDCSRDFSQTCPAGWHLADGECTAPSGYSGGCATTQSFVHMTPAKKEHWSVSCSAGWPCFRDCPSKDLGSACPADWSISNGGMTCTAPSTYSGPCAAQQNGIGDMGEQEKRDLAEKCQLTWPCEGELSSDLAATASGAQARMSADPARYTTASGPIAGSGSIVS